MCYTGPSQAQGPSLRLRTGVFLRALLEKKIGCLSPRVADFLGGLESISCFRLEIGLEIGYQTFPAVFFLRTFPSGSPLHLQFAMADLENFFAALRAAAEEANLSLDTIWKYKGGSPLALRQAVMERGPPMVATALGFCLAANMFGTILNPKPLNP